MTKWGPWVRVTDDKRPAELTDDDERIQCVYVNGKGELMNDADGEIQSERSVGSHMWGPPEDMVGALTLAYRRLA